MSLVGTRPPTVDEWDKYELHHRARLATKPGLTGMWQVSGRSNITDLITVAVGGAAVYRISVNVRLNKLIDNSKTINITNNTGSIEEMYIFIEACLIMRVFMIYLTLIQKRSR